MHQSPLKGVHTDYQGGINETSSFQWEVQPFLESQSPTIIMPIANKTTPYTLKHKAETNTEHFQPCCPQNGYGLWESGNCWKCSSVNSLLFWFSESVEITRECTKVPWQFLRTSVDYLWSCIVSKSKRLKSTKATWLTPRCFFWALVLSGKFGRKCRNTLTASPLNRRVSILTRERNKISGDWPLNERGVSLCDEWKEKINTELTTISWCGVLSSAKKCYRPRAALLVSVQCLPAFWNSRHLERSDKR